MAWKDTLLDASFRGVRFDCKNTRDSLPRATAQHAYPYLDGADVEDMGGEAIRISMEAVFWGDDYESRAKAFLAKLKEPGEGDLVHPVFGVIKAQFAGGEVVHDAESPDSCQVSLQFVESTPGNPFFDRQLPSQKSAAAFLPVGFAREGAADLLSDFVAGVAGLSGAYSRINALRNGMSGGLSGFMSEVAGFIPSGLDMLLYPRAWAGDITSVIGMLAGMFQFDNADPMQEWGGLSARMASSPLGIPSQPSGTAMYSDSRAISAHVSLEQSLGLAESASDLFVSEAKSPTLYPAQIERVASDVRAALQGSVDEYRSIYPIEQSRRVTEPLKDTAYAIQEAAASIIEARPPLVKKTVEAPGNLHLLAHRWYGDYTRAGELARLNPRLRLVNFIQPGEVVNAFAR